MASKVKSPQEAQGCSAGAPFLVSSRITGTHILHGYGLLLLLFPGGFFLFHFSAGAGAAVAVAVAVAVVVGARAFVCRVLLLELADLQRRGVELGLEPGHLVVAAAPVLKGGREATQGSGKPPRTRRLDWRKERGK